MLEFFISKYIRVEIVHIEWYVCLLNNGGARLYGDSEVANFHVKHEKINAACGEYSSLVERAVSWKKFLCTLDAAAFSLPTLIMVLFFALYCTKCEYAVDSWCKFLQSTEKCTFNESRENMRIVSGGEGRREEKAKRNKRGFKATQFESMAKWWHTIVVLFLPAMKNFRCHDVQSTERRRRLSSQKFTSQQCAFWVFIIRIQFILHATAWEKTEKRNRNRIAKKNSKADWIESNDSFGLCLSFVKAQPDV